MCHDLRGNTRDSTFTTCLGYLTCLVASRWAQCTLHRSSSYRRCPPTLRDLPTARMSRWLKITAVCQCSSATVVNRKLQRGLRQRSWSFRLGRRVSHRPRDAVVTRWALLGPGRPPRRTRSHGQAYSSPGLFSRASRFRAWPACRARDVACTGCGIMQNATQGS